MFRYPQLLASTTAALVDERRIMTVRDAAANASWEHPATVYSPLGDPRVSPERLKRLRAEMLLAAKNCGYPNPPDRSQARTADMGLLRVISREVAMSAHESSHPGVWEFLTCVLAPDVVVWRFAREGGGVTPERFKAGRRNTLERLWRRWQFLGQTIGGVEDYSLLEELTEDETVQIMERPSILGHKLLMRSAAEIATESAVRRKVGRVFIRDMQKRLLRLAAVRSIDSLVATETHSLAAATAEASENALAN